MKTLKVLSFVVVGALGLLFRAYWAEAQQAGLPPLPPGYVYQAIAKTNAGDGLFVTAESLNLPPLPPGFVFGVVPEPTACSSVDC